MRLIHSVEFKENKGYGEPHAETRVSLDQRLPAPVGGERTGKTENRKPQDQRIESSSPHTQRENRECATANSPGILSATPPTLLAKRGVEDTVLPVFGLKLDCAAENTAETDVLTYKLWVCA